MRKPFGAVALPPNPFQRRLACFAAGIMNTTAALFFLAGMPVGAFVTGGMLLVLQAIVIFTHFCTLSWIYEGLMRALGLWSRPIELAAARALLSDGALLIDVRGRDEYAAGHLETSINIPLEELDGHVGALRASPVLVHCQSGARSQIAAQKLKKLGLDKVYDLGAFEQARAVERDTRGLP